MACGREIGRWNQGAALVRGSDGGAGGRRGGGDVFEKRTFNGWVARQSYGPVDDGSCSSGSGLGIVGRKRDCGLVSQGPIPLKGDAWAGDGAGCGPAEGLAPKGLELLSHGPAISDGNGVHQVAGEGDLGQADAGPQCSMAEREIVDEAFKYGSYSNLKVGESSSSSSPFGRTPEREPCDHHGVLRVSRQRDNVVEGEASGGDIARREGCWDLVAVDCEVLEVQNPEWTLAMSGPKFKGARRSLIGRKAACQIQGEGKEESLLKSRGGQLLVGLMNLKLMSWNVRGANDVNKRRIIKSVGWEILRLENSEATGVARGLWKMGQSGFFTGVYGPFNKKDRECLWDELGAVRPLGDPWCVGGDFNVILTQGERSRQGRVTPAMRRFAQVMDDLELIDLPLQGGSFTWSGGLHNQAWARLDRFLVSPRWLDQRGPSPFRFENMWLRVEGFKDLEELVAGDGVDYWDQVESERRLSEEEFARKKEAKEGYAKWVKMDEIHWRQLSRELWLREGDKNTGHRGVNLNRISQQEADILELPFMEEEVHSALRDMNGTRLQVRMALRELFGNFCWEFVKRRLWRCSREFHEHKTFLKSLNATFLVLIPKKGGSGGAGGLRADQFCWVDYTNSWLRLANRIKNVIGGVISSDQNAFVSASIGNFDEGYGGKWALGLSGGSGYGAAYQLPVGEVDEILEMAVELAARTDEVKTSPMEAAILGSGEKTENCKETSCGEGESTERKAHLVSWEKVCVEQREGGTWLEEIVQLNKALLGKWVWRFACAKDEMWNVFLWRNTGKRILGGRTKKANGAFGGWLWKEIMKEADWCWNNMTLKVGKGTKIRFWKDTWCGMWSWLGDPSTLQCGCPKSATVGEL
ncbi:hypothetical protein CK203_063541 [Vitis vinifera]|uniref:Uncharacterized protein n=1 Tax=Vitis vinifera TaxID=29760 RepID=A0A438G3G6_VITVI|nr:hypothetical protein CK203_063541 [Vitis vinifera]